MNASTPSGTTPLSVAAHEGLTDFIKCLLEAGADPNVVNEVALALFHFCLSSDLLSLASLFNFCCTF